MTTASRSLATALRMGALRERLAPPSYTTSWDTTANGPLHSPQTAENRGCNRSLSHANRVSGRAFTAHRETDFRTSETKGPNPLPDGLRFPQRPRTVHCTRPKPRKIEGVPRRRGTRG